MRIHKTLLPFLIISALELAARFNDLQEVSNITKPLVMPALIFYVLRVCPAFLLKNFLLVALGLSFLGDVLLMFDSNETFFLFGLGSFLIAHLIYAFTFFNSTDQVERKFKFEWPDILFIAYGLFVFSSLKDSLGDMYIPTLIYTVVICLMGITARKRWKKVNDKSFWFVMAGALLFMVSDTILAVDKFYSSFEKAGFLTMLTYIAAQFLIAEGLILFLQKIRPSTGS